MPWKGGEDRGARKGWREETEGPGVEETGGGGSERGERGERGPQRRGQWQSVLKGLGHQMD